MSLRTVALDTPRFRVRATRCDPTGWAVSTYSSTTARRIAALRSSIAIPVPLPATCPIAMLAVSTQVYRVPMVIAGLPFSGSVDGAVRHRRVGRGDNAGRLLLGDREPKDGAAHAERRDIWIGPEHARRDDARRLALPDSGPELVGELRRQPAQVALHQVALAVGQVDDPRRQRTIGRRQPDLRRVRIARRRLGRGEHPIAVGLPGEIADAVVLLNVLHRQHTDQDQRGCSGNRYRHSARQSGMATCRRADLLGGRELWR